MRARFAVALLATASLLLSAGIWTPAASAARTRARTAVQPFFDYTLSFTGSGTYSVTGHDGGATLTVNASFAWKSVYPNVLVPTAAGNQLGSVGFTAYGPGQEGSGKWKITNTGSDGQDCNNEGALGLMGQLGGEGGGGEAKVRRPGPGAGGGVVLELQALTEFATTSGSGNGALACDPSSFWREWVTSFTGVGHDHSAAGLHDVQPLTTTLKLAPRDLRHGTVTKHVAIGAAEQVPSSCGDGSGTSCSQSYTWSGSVRFTKHRFKA